MSVNPKNKPNEAGFIAHDVIDKFGRLLLAKGTALTPEIIQKLENQKLLTRLSPIN